MCVHSKATPILLSGAYFQESVDIIAALVVLVRQMREATVDYLSGLYSLRNVPELHVNSASSHPLSICVDNTLHIFFLMVK